MINPFVGEIVLYAFSSAPQGWAPCEGQLIPANQNVPLFSVIGNIFGGDGKTTFALPDYRSIVPRGLQYCIALTGIHPLEGPSRPQGVGEIASLPFNFTPTLWVGCNGELLEISGNERLFDAIGTKFGGDGQSSFGVPRLIQTPPKYPWPLPPTNSIYFIAGEGGAAPVEPIMAEVRLFPFDLALRGWETCRGQVLQIAQGQALFHVIGTAFGGDGRTTFALPDLREAPLPSGLYYCIATEGAFPS
jgi:microcystin-dependent protein